MAVVQAGRWMVRLVLGLAAMSASELVSAGAHLPMARDFAREARQAQGRAPVFVVLVSQPDCRYCDQIRAAYLQPLLRHKPARLVLREVGLTSSKPLRDFAGGGTTQKEFAHRYQVKVTPTVLFLDGRGLPLARPLPGADTAGFYGAYLQSALDKAFAAADAGAHRDD